MASFRNSVAFGRRIEYWIIGRMLKDGLDVYVPLVDDDAIDAVVRKPSGKYLTVQIKARSKDGCQLGSGGLFAGLTHESRKDYWFVFYSERLDLTWLLSSSQFIKEARLLKGGESAGKRTLHFNGMKNGEEYCHERYKKYLVTNFSRLK